MSTSDPTRELDLDDIKTTPLPPPKVNVPDTRTKIDPLSWVGWPVGGAMVVWALVAVARTGFNDFAPYASTEVAGLGTSRLLAIIVGITGLLIWGAVAGNPRDVEVRVIGAVAIVVGLVLMIEPAPFRPYLGIDRDFGVVSLIVGLVLAATSLLPPFSVGRDPNR